MPSDKLRWRIFRLLIQYPVAKVLMIFIIGLMISPLHYILLI